MENKTSFIKFILRQKERKFSKNLLIKTNKQTNKQRKSSNHHFNQNLKSINKEKSKAIPTTEKNPSSPALQRFVESGEAVTETTSANNIRKKKSLARKITNRNHLAHLNRLLINQKMLKCEFFQNVKIASTLMETPAEDLTGRIDDLRVLKL